jgi:hypothetical protein
MSDEHCNMTMVEGHTFKTWWECSACNSEHKPTVKFERSKSCPICCAVIDKWIGTDVEDAE